MFFEYSKDKNDAHLHSNRDLQKTQLQNINKCKTLTILTIWPMQKIDFYFDFLSPFSYFAWINHKTKIIKMVESQKVDFCYKPVLMGRLFAQHGFPGPGEIKAKRAYELKKCFRYASRNKIPFSPPSTFPFNPLAIIRLATKAASKEQQAEIIDLIFKSVWSESKVLDDPALVESLLSVHEFPSHIYEDSFNREAKTELKANIKEALSKDIFGVPSFVINDEYFWGNDSFEDINQYLSKNDIWNKKLYNEVLSNNQLD